MLVLADFHYTTNDFLTEWEEFPNGRWGNSSAATFGDVSEHHLFYMRSKTSKEQRLNMWGRQLVGEEDVWKVFYNFITDTPDEESGAKVSLVNIPENVNFLVC